MTSFLTFYRDETPGFEPPSRVYARVDHISTSGPTPESERVALLDSVNAYWFDEVGGWRSSLADPEFADETDEHVSVIEAPLSPGEDQLDGVRLDEDWMLLELGPPGTGRPVSHYLNLFAPPIERSLLSVSPVPIDLKGRLDTATGLQDVSNARADEIFEMLSRLPTPDAAAVYDVGQGGCNALLHGGAPILYFDLGGGVLRNQDTFPQALSQFCFSSDPPIVLSHWDWDHWSSAGRDPRAHHCAWIVPRQVAPLGFVHAAFLARVRANGRVLVWPQRLRGMTVDDVAVVKCTGPPRSRNDSGLALILESMTDGERTRMLFPGDAAYDYVPGSSLEFTDVVAPHHGGRTRSTFVPSSDARSCGRLVYSYGDNNSYGHPFPDVIQDHAVVWATNLKTSDRDASGLGHVHLYIRNGDPDAHPPCHGAECQLTCHQR